MQEFNKSLTLMQIFEAYQFYAITHNQPNLVMMPPLPLLFTTMAVDMATMTVTMALVTATTAVTVTARAVAMVAAVMSKR